VCVCVCVCVLKVMELGWDYVHGWAGMGGTRLGTTRSVLLSRGSAIDPTLMLYVD